MLKLHSDLQIIARNWCNCLEDLLSCSCYSWSKAFMHRLTQTRPDSVLVHSSSHGTWVFPWQYICYPDWDTCIGVFFCIFRAMLAPGDHVAFLNLVFWLQTALGTQEDKEEETNREMLLSTSMHADSRSRKDMTGNSSELRIWNAFSFPEKWNGAILYSLSSLKPLFVTTRIMSPLALLIE